MVCASTADNPPISTTPVGPITITVSDPDGDESTHEFCNWECLGHWAAECAGGVLVIERN
jgi:hypothetical protein